MICPQCRSEDCFRSRRTRVADYFWSLCDVKPWRCRTCEMRFYARRVALPFSLFAHCPRCGNLDLDRISRDRVDWGTLVAVKRWLAWPAYRCDPCRRKFFSVLPFRRILPSTIASTLSPGVPSSAKGGTRNSRPDSDREELDSSKGPQVVTEN